MSRGVHPFRGCNTRTNPGKESEFHHRSFAFLTRLRMLSVHRAGRREAVSHLGVPQRSAGETRGGKTHLTGDARWW